MTIDEAYAACATITSPRPRTSPTASGSCRRPSAPPCRPSTRWPVASTTSATATCRRPSKLGRARPGPEPTSPRLLRSAGPTTRSSSPSPTPSTRYQLPLEEFDELIDGCEHGRQRCTTYDDLRRPRAATAAGGRLGRAPVARRLRHGRTRSRAEPLADGARGRPPGHEHPPRRRGGPRHGPRLPARRRRRAVRLRARPVRPAARPSPRSSPFEIAPGRGTSVRQGLELLPLLDRRSRACVAAMAGIYRRLLGRIEADPAAVLDGRVSLPTQEKAWVAVRAITRGGGMTARRRRRSAGAWPGSAPRWPPPTAAPTVTLLERRPRLGGAHVVVPARRPVVRQRPARVPAVLHRRTWRSSSASAPTSRVHLQHRLEVPVLAPGARDGLAPPGAAAGAVPPRPVARRATTTSRLVDRVRLGAGRARAARASTSTTPPSTSTTFGGWLAATRPAPGRRRAPVGPDRPPTAQPPGRRRVARLLAAKVFRTGLLDHRRRRPTSAGRAMPLGAAARRAGPPPRWRAPGRRGAHRRPPVDGHRSTGDRFRPWPSAGGRIDGRRRDPRRAPPTSPPRCCLPAPSPTGRRAAAARRTHRRQRPPRAMTAGDRAARGRRGGLAVAVRLRPHGGAGRDDAARCLAVSLSAADD